MDKIITIIIRPTQWNNILTITLDIQWFWISDNNNYILSISVATQKKWNPRWANKKPQTTQGQIALQFSVISNFSPEKSYFFPKNPSFSRKKMIFYPPKFLISDDLVLYFFLVINSNFKIFPLFSPTTRHFRRNRSIIPYFSAKSTRKQTSFPGNVKTPEKLYKNKSPRSEKNPENKGSNFSAIGAKISDDLFYS